MSWNRFFRKTILPLALLLFTPSLVIAMWYTNVHLEGSLTRLLHLAEHEGVLSTLYHMWSPIFFGSKTAWLMIVLFSVLQLAFMKILPGKYVEGPLTPKGNVPIYKANGVPAFLSTLGLFYICTHVFHFFPATIIYDHLGELLGALNLFSLCFCLFLYVKGRVSPSSSDVCLTGNFLFDFFSGVELYPRIKGWDVKLFTNCRFGMMGWSLVILSFAAKQAEVYGLSNSMLIAVLLQLIYIAKFFVWETGYLRSMDIMHDRAGYMICWGCLVWVTGIYTSPTLYLVNHPHQLHELSALALFIVGTFSILVNYFVDRQRVRIRATQGDCLIWNRKPTVIQAKYKTEEGEQKQTVLLASGWWGISRHFHYIPEILAALCWSLPALFTSPLPYFYVVFLTILLTDRAFRHERRCAQKYGEHWDAYCKQVPYKLFPFIY